MTLEAFVTKYKNVGLSVEELSRRLVSELGSEDISMAAKDALGALAEVEGWADEQGFSLVYP